MFRSVCFIFCAVFASTIQAHELFLQPQSYQIDVGAPLVAEVKVGEEFDGGRSIYNPNKFRRFEYAFGDRIEDVPGRLGDLPSVNVLTEVDGLHVVVHTSTDQRLKYTEFAKFKAFAEHKDLTQAIAAHKARGLPVDAFYEAYSRYAKSLISVGDGAGQDRSYGLETEIVALVNPYTDELNGEMPVQVFYQGTIRVDAQIELFERMGSDVDITFHRTDDDGIARLPVKPGAQYMVDAVVIREPDAALATQLDAVWETLWANLTFAVPK